MALYLRLSLPYRPLIRASSIPSLIIRITPAASPLAQVIIILPSYQRYCHSWSHTTIALFEVLRLVTIDQPLRGSNLPSAQSVCSLKRDGTGVEGVRESAEGERSDNRRAPLSPLNILSTRTIFISVCSRVPLSRVFLFSHPLALFTIFEREFLSRRRANKT